MLILHATTGIFCLVSVEVVMALTLHMPGTLDLIIKGVLAGGIFSDSVVLCVTSQLNVIIAIMVNMMIFFIGFPFGIKHELSHPKGTRMLFSDYKPVTFI